MVPVVTLLSQAKCMCSIEISFLHRSVPLRIGAPVHLCGHVQKETSRATVMEEA